MNPFDLSGKTALVTGASRGIGAACARALDRQGARVAVAARSTAELEALAKELEHDGVAITADVSEPTGVDELVGSAIDALGAVDILVNNAGVGSLTLSRDLKADDVERVLRVNLLGAMLVASRVGAHMVGRGTGSIINMSSRAATSPAIHMAAYTATKGGLDAVTRALASEWGPKGVRVNAVAPGVIHTDMWDAGLKVPGLREQIEGNTALRRVGTAEDVADVVAFLASDASRFVTGQVIDVDGGLPSDGVLPRLE